MRAAPRPTADPPAPLPRRGHPAPRGSRRTLLWTSSSYFGEGLPWSFLHQLATEYLTAIGASKTAISSTSLLHIGVLLKFVWSPIVDLYGQKRRWVVVTQLVLAVGMAGTAAVVSTGSSALFWIVLALLAVVQATHDIACDGFYLSALNQHDRALFSGARTAAYRAAMFVGSSVLVYLAGQTSWPLAFGSAGLLMLLVAGLNARVLPRAPDAPARRESTPRAFIASAYRSFFQQPHASSVLAFMLLYRLGDIMMFAMSKPLLRDIGITTAERGIINGVGLFASLGGSIAGGALIARHGLERCLVPMTYIQNLAIPLYALMAVVQPRFLGVTVMVVLEQLAAGIGAANSGVFLMQRTSRAFTSSHFALATSVVMLGSTVSGYLSGPLNEALGHPAFFTLAFVVSWPSLVLVHFVPKKPLDPPSTKGAEG